MSELTRMLEGQDGGLLPEQRGPCYEAWTAQRDYWEALGERVDITDFRSGFMFGWAALEQVKNELSQNKKRRQSP